MKKLALNTKIDNKNIQNMSIASNELLQCYDNRFRFSDDQIMNIMHASYHTLSH